MGVQDRKLAADEPDAAIVRHVRQSYLAQGSVRLLRRELVREGVRSKVVPATATRQPAAASRWSPATGPERQRARECRPAT